MKHIPIDEDEEIEDPYSSTPVRRIIGHHILDMPSFQNMSKIYMIITPIIVLVILVSIKLGTFAILINRMNFEPALNPDLAVEFMRIKESLYLGILATTIPQILLWATLLYPLLKMLGGKGDYFRTLSIYSTAHIPVVIGSFILLLIAIAQPITPIPTNVENFSIVEAFNYVTQGYRIANFIIVPVTSLYTHVIAGTGLSAEHKMPQLLGIIVGVIASILAILFYFLV
ncbi:MAG: YIP1 family protein [Candidatus Heimdallarchaeaceae archaeon]